MALFTYFKTVSLIRNNFRVNFVLKNRFHSLTKSLHNAPPKTHHRTFFSEIFRKPSQRDLKIKDDVPDSFQLIYRNPMSRYLLGAQMVSLVTGGVVFIGLLFGSEFRTPRQFQTWSPTARTTKNEEVAYITIFVLFIVLLQVMINKTPIRIYKVPDSPKYISINYGNYFFGKERFTFRRGEIVHMEERGLLPWRQNRYLIESETDRRVIILLEHYFRRPADLHIMLGEQKDPDLDK